MFANQLPQLKEILPDADEKQADPMVFVFVSLIEKRYANIAMSELNAHFSLKDEQVKQLHTQFLD